MNEGIKKAKRIMRHKRIRAKISGNAKFPRLCVFRSERYIYAQLIDDETGKTLLSVSDKGLKGKKKTTSTVETAKKGKDEGVKEEKEILKGKTLLAHKVGELIAKKALQEKIEKVVFDRGGYKYHGRVKALADGARKGGLKF